MVLNIDDTKSIIINSEFMPYQEEFIKTITSSKVTAFFYTRATGRTLFVKRLKACFASGIFPIVAPSLPSIEAFNDKLFTCKDFETNKNLQHTYGWYRNFEKKRFGRGGK